MSVVSGMEQGAWSMPARKARKARKAKKPVSLLSRFNPKRMAPGGERNMLMQLIRLRRNYGPEQLWELERIGLETKRIVIFEPY